MVGHGYAESFSASGRIETFSGDHGLEPRHQRFQLSKHLFSPHGALIRATTANEQHIPEHLAQPFQRSAHRRLTQEASLGCSGYVPFLQQRM